MKLAYADAFGVHAFGVKTFVLLHHLDYQGLKSRQAGVPPLLLASQCNEDYSGKSSSMTFVNCSQQDRPDV
ncbi:MAG TPA: hypothetical protein DDZ76_09750 [Xanthomonadales bacterium]|nr:hypothetical protein [Xanthomonadales bacterium]